MQFRLSLGPSVLVGLLILTGVLLEILAWYFPQWLGIRADSDRQHTWLLAIPACTIIVVMLLGAYRLLWGRLGQSVYRVEEADDVLEPPRTNTPKSLIAQEVRVAQVSLKDYYGSFWRLKVRVLLVVGEPEQIEAIA
ncbi:hypothetical protein PU99_24760, partial [Pseudomonas putida]